MKTSRSTFLGCALMAVLLLAFPGVRSLGQVLVWGDNSYGQINVPPGATNIIALAAGDAHCLALAGDGTVVSWGAYSAGQTHGPVALTNAVAIAAGSSHSLALRADGTVTLWGSIWPSGANLVPANATNIAGLALGPGAQHALALKADGTVLDWGNNYYDLSNPPPTARNIVAVAAGAVHGLALRSDGRVVAWGDNSSGQLNVPAAATNIVAIAAGWYDNAALRADGTVLVWGTSSPPLAAGFTNLVDVTCPMDSRPASYLLALRQNGSLTEWPMALPAYPTNKIAAIAAGSADGLALVGSGPPAFWGRPVNREIASVSTAYFRLQAAGARPMYYQWMGNGTNLPGATNSVFAVTNAQPSMAGTCFTLLASNALGAATSGPMFLYETPSELELAATNVSAVVAQTVTLRATSIGQGPLTYQWRLDGTNVPAGTNLTLTVTGAQLSDAGLYSLVASNGFGSVTGFVSVAVAATITTNRLQDQLAFSGGSAAFSIGLEALIPVAYQWQFGGTDLPDATGDSLVLTNVQEAQAGTYRVVFSDSYEVVTNSASLALVAAAAWGDMEEQSLTPALTNLIAISSGETHGLALQSDGTVVGWGNDGTGAATTPPGLANVIAIAAGRSGSLALRNDGTVGAWGDNSSGQTNVPPGLTNVVAIAAGGAHNLAVQADGEVVAWGDNTYGQTNVPAGLANVVSVAAGRAFSVALRADGTVVTWGSVTNLPVNLSNVVQVAAGEFDGLALHADGSVIGWGQNADGEDTPPGTLSNVVALAAGQWHSLALRDNGKVVAWGYDYFGETNVPAGLSNVVAVSARGFHNLALVGNGPPQLHVPVSGIEQSATGFSLSLSTQSGRVYALEYKNSLADNNWVALPLRAGTGSMLTLTDPRGITGQRFYRVRRW